MNVFSYIRVSGVGQVENDGPVRQREAITTFCSRFSLSVLGEFSEDGVSGTVEAMDRPKFADMLAKIVVYATTPDVKIGAIVVERMDRLARDLMVSEFLLAECRKAGIKVFCTDQGALIDMAENDGDPTRKMLRQILGAISEWDKSVTVRKLRAARLRCRQNGKCEGAKPYGFFPGEKEVLTFVTEQKAVGKSWANIANQLNHRGIRTRFKKDWNKQNLSIVYTQRRVRYKTKKETL
jgi:DNA invertase Pin-like site-specific DNA recombinase